MQKASVPEHVAHYHYQKALADMLPEMGSYIAQKMWESLSLEDQGNLITLVTRDLEPYEVLGPGGKSSLLLDLGLAVKIVYKGVFCYLACTEIGYQVWERGEAESFKEMRKNTSC